MTNLLTSLSGIRDNHSRGKVADFLQANISAGSVLSIVSAYFTIYAYEALADQLNPIDHLRFLFGEPRFINALDPSKTESKSFKIEDQGLSLSQQLQQKEVARQCAEWIQQKVEIRSVRQANLLHGKLYHINDGQHEHVIFGSSNFTQSGLGLAATSNIELNLIVDNERDQNDLKAWFDDLWNNDKLVEDVKAKVLLYLEQLYVDPAPEFVYFKTLFHIFEQFLLGQAVDSALFDQTAIIDTHIWKALFDFQKDGVKGAIHKINRHNGCIVADSVGLGKTYLALAVIKYFELRNYRVLVLCPKKLRENWTVYLAQNVSELNPFLKDRFAYTVLSHTDLSRESGVVDGINLQTLNWNHFDLVVIDESHNFRNNTKGKRDEDGNLIRKSRYERLMQDIIKGGVKTRVLLLSATPVNNDLQDLRNQIYLVTEGQDQAFSQSFGIPSIKNLLGIAQKTFMEWAKSSTEKRDVRHLLDRLSAGFFTLMDQLTIARSRQHIQKYYQASLAQIGQFPIRHKPESIFSSIDTKDRFPSYDRLNDEISHYQLSLFNPSSYVKDEYKAHYEAEKIRNFSQMAREGFLIGMMKVNFLKRLESSVHSFGITMNRTVDKIEALENRLKAFKSHQAHIDEEVQPDLLVEPEEEDEELAQAFQVGSKLKFAMAHLRVDDWLDALKTDKQNLAWLAAAAQAVHPEHDAKLARLREIIQKKALNSTINRRGERNRKVVVFCAFADTAAYLYEQLEELAQDLGVHIALVSGGTRPNRTTLGRAEFNEILVNFSPRSKQRDKMKSMPQQEEIDLLIATDCISEGQNLQDCDLLVNYDIHWNPVRIIQRFGRIDRIGSLNEVIYLINFWPTDDLDQYVNLKNRVEARMALVDVAATGTDNLLALPDMADVETLIRQDLHYRDQQLLRMKDEVLDLEDFSEMVALTEFTLDDFRMELARYIEANRAKLDAAPLGLYAVVPPHPDFATLQPGVIFCLKQRQDGIGSETVNPLQPYFLVYIRDDGEVRYNFTAPKQILELFRLLCQGKTEPYSALCQLFNAETQHGADMNRYNGLIDQAVKAIVAQFGKKNFASLFTGKQAKLVKASHSVKSADDFDLISWLVIKHSQEQTNPA